MVYDCIIIGGGPAGLSAALVLGRAKLNVLLIDNNDPRNKVTNESHGFITNDSLSPDIIREKAKKDLIKYASIQLISDTVTDVMEQDSFFVIETLKRKFEANRIILATGLKETLPNIKGLQALYGDLFFSCPFCDGWELRDKKLAIITEHEENVIGFSTMIHHWSNNLVVFTNGIKIDSTTKATLSKNNIKLFEEKIDRIEKMNGQSKIYLQNSHNIEVEGGFLTPQLEVKLSFAEKLSLTLDNSRRIKTNEAGETSHKNIYAAGDIKSEFKEQLVHAASSGSLVAAGIVKELASKGFISA